MRFILKIAFGAAIFLGVIFGIGVILDEIQDYEEAKFTNVVIPENLKFKKPFIELTNKQIDSLLKVDIDKPKLLVVGNWGSYGFYIRHKPTEKGIIFIKAFELTQNIRLSEPDLSNNTRIKISELNQNYKIFKSGSTIYEGTFDKFYPVRFELWFKSKKSGIEKKMTEENYLIDGWDR